VRARRVARGAVEKLAAGIDERAQGELRVAGETDLRTYRLVQVVGIAREMNDRFAFGIFTANEFSEKLQPAPKITSALSRKWRTVFGIAAPPAPSASGCVSSKALFPRGSCTRATPVIRPIL